MISTGSSNTAVGASALTFNRIANENTAIGASALAADRIGSQNTADPQFRIKAKYAPWIDVLLRCEGPVVRQAQHLFLGTWIAETGEDLYGLPAAAPEPERYDDGVVAQMFGTGPTTPGNPMSDPFVSARCGTTSPAIPCRRISSSSGVTSSP